MDKAYDRLPTLRSRELRNSSTKAERKLWAALRNKQLAGVRFNRQVPIGPYICDFVARTLRFIIEVDGGQHAEQAEADQARTAYLERKGYVVLRFWNNEVLGNIEGVVKTIERELVDRPSPNPSRQAGGEEARSAEGEGMLSPDRPSQSLPASGRGS